MLEIDDKNDHGLSSRGERVLREFGSEIFRSVFVNAPSIQDIYARSKGAARDLRIKLRIESAELAGLPWEYLYDEDDMPGFVSLTRPIVRYLETAGGVGRMGVKGPLRILGMIADPATSEWPKLNVVKGRDRINKGIDALQHEGKVDFQWVPGGTGKDLMKKLLEGEWHIFHFIGHGGVEERDANGGAVSTAASSCWSTRTANRSEVRLRPATMLTAHARAFGRGPELLRKRQINIGDSRQSCDG